MATHTLLPLLIAGNGLPMAMASHPPVPGDATVNLAVTGLRSAKGMVRACLTRNPRFFPHCEKDPDAYKESVPAGPGASLRFTGVAAGDYAITVLHDENGNFRADMMLGIPREGVGFSENPVVRFGPPKFAAAQFRVNSATVTQWIVMKYFL